MSLTRDRCPLTLNQGGLLALKTKDEEADPSQTGFVKSLPLLCFRQNRLHLFAMVLAVIEEEFIKGSLQ